MRKIGASWEVVKELGEDTKMQRRLRAAFGAADTIGDMANHLEASDTVYLACSLLEHQVRSRVRGKQCIATAVYNGWLLLGEIVNQFGNVETQESFMMVSRIMPSSANHDTNIFQKLDKDISKLDNKAMPAAKMIATALVAAKRLDCSAAHIIHWPIQVTADQVGTQHSEAIAKMAAEYFRTSLELFEV